MRSSKSPTRLKKTGGGTAAILLTFTAFFFLAEGALRLYLSRVAVYDTEMSRYSLSLKVDSPNPLIGHVHKPMSNARLMSVPVHINSDGLRDKEYPIARSNMRRIIFLGDSLTFGWGVEQLNSFESILERRLNTWSPVEVLNFGTGNYNTEQEVNLFLEKGLKYQPDKVVLFYFINDAEKTPKKSRLWFFAHSRLISFYWSRISTTLNNLFLSRNFNEYYSSLYRGNPEGWTRAQKAFVQLKSLCQQRNILFQVVLLPELHNLKNYPFKKEHTKLALFLESVGIDYLDISPRFEGYENPTELWVSLDDAHPNTIAHRLIAEYSLDFIAKNLSGE